MKTVEMKVSIGKGADKKVIPASKEVFETWEDVENAVGGHERILKLVNYANDLKVRAKVRAEASPEGGKILRRNRTTAYAMQSEFRDDVVKLLMANNTKELHTYLDELYEADKEAIDAM